MSRDFKIFTVHSTGDTEASLIYCTVVPETNKSSPKLFGKSASLPLMTENALASIIDTRLEVAHRLVEGIKYVLPQCSFRTDRPTSTHCRDDRWSRRQVGNISAYARLIESDALIMDRNF